MDCTIDISVENNSLSILGLNHPPLDCVCVRTVEDVVLRLLCDMKVESRVIPTTSVVCKEIYKIEKGCNIKLFKVDKNTIRSIWDEMKIKFGLHCAHIKYNEFDGSILEWLSNLSADVCSPAELVSCECCEWRGGEWVRRVGWELINKSNPNLIPVSEIYKARIFKKIE